MHPSSVASYFIKTFVISVNRIKYQNDVCTTLYQIKCPSLQTRINLEKENKNHQYQICAFLSNEAAEWGKKRSNVATTYRDKLRMKKKIIYVYPIFHIHDNRFAYSSSLSWFSRADVPNELDSSTCCVILWSLFLDEFKVDYATKLICTRNIVLCVLSLSFYFFFALSLSLICLISFISVFLSLFAVSISPSFFVALQSVIFIHSRLFFIRPKFSVIDRDGFALQSWELERENEK